MKAKRKTYYVQTEEEMRRQLLERGLEDTSLEDDTGRVIEGDDMRKLCATLGSTDEAIKALERRGINLQTHAERINVEDGRLPVFHVQEGNSEHWFSNRDKLESFIDERRKETGDQVEVDTDSTDDEEGEETQNKIQINEFHEVKTINSGLKTLMELGFDVNSLMPQDRTGTEEARYRIRRGENESGIEDLRELLTAVRAAGEKGLQVTRFKGLGEMNAEELRETTLDPENRSLIQVNMSNAAEADDLFRILMGDKVEPRREFIEKHALEVKNLDV